MSSCKHGFQKSKTFGFNCPDCAPKRLMGSVLWFDARDGYGIIKTDEGHEFYTDISVTPERKPLKEGSRVSFVRNSEIKHVACAKDVELA